MDDTEEMTIGEDDVAQLADVIDLLVPAAPVSDTVADQDAHARATIPNVNWDAYPLRPDGKS